MTKIKTLAVAMAITVLGGGAAFAADAMKGDSMKSDAMTKKEAAMMKTCEAMGDKAKTDKMCMAAMKKHDAMMKGDAMKGDHMSSDAMKGDH